MQPNSKSVNEGEASFHNVANSDQWWNNTGYNSFSAAAMRGNASDSSSPEQSENGQSQSEGAMNDEDDDTVKQPDKNLQHVEPIIHPRPDGTVAQPVPLELVGHSIACASNPYDPYYGGMMAAAYGQPMVPHLYDMHHVRMPLPLEMAQEPVYVNAKQYHGILRRRQSRAKAELEKKLIKTRKPYLHESRHQHAMRRQRGSGGRFAKKSEAEASNGKASGSASASSPQSMNSSGAEVSEDQNVYNADAGNYRKQSNLQEAVYESHSGKMGEGSAASQHWGNIPSNRALAMQ